MALTDTQEFTAYNSFNTSGIVTSDTFNSWRKKNNGMINEIDRVNDLITNISITPEQLSLGAPTWTEAGALQTYNDGAGTFKAGAITCTSLNAGSGTLTTTGSISGSGITGTSLKVGGSVASPSTGAVNALSLAVGTNNTQFTVSAAGAVNALSLAVGTNNTQFTVSAAGAVSAASSITGTSLKVGGSVASPSTGAVNSLSLAVGTNNTQFTVSAAGAITGASLNIGSGAITSGAITCTSLNAGSGTITTTGNAIAATPTLSTHLTTKGYVDGMFAYGTLNSVPGGGTLPFFEFTSIPAAVKRITLMLGAASTNGTSQLAIVLGTSSGYDTSGYTSSVSRNGGTFDSTTSFVITEYTNASDGYSGCIVLNRYVTGVNTWILTGTVISQNDSRVHSSGGLKALGTGNVLDRIKITTVGGVNVFDGGSTNIMFEY